MKVAYPLLSLFLIMGIAFFAGCTAPGCKGGETRECKVNDCLGIQTCSAGIWDNCIVKDKLTCATVAVVCGNGICETNETQINCCTDCGCPLNQTCNTTTGFCYTIPTQFCPDGTPSKMCSTLWEGKYCHEGELSNDCAKCGCFSNYKCLQNGSCSVISFFEGDPIIQDILSGKVYELTESNLFSDFPKSTGKVITSSFEYKLINALGQLGFYLWTSGPNESVVTVSLHKFQKKHGLPISNVLNKETFTLINSELKGREMLDKKLAENYPPFAKFIPAPVNEPPAQHLAALYAVLLTAMPAEVKNAESFWTVEEFGNSLAWGMGGNLGKMIDPSGSRVLLPNESILIMQKKEEFRFCGDAYYFKFRELVGGNCVSPPDIISSIPGGDVAYMRMFVHEYGHSIGRDARVQLPDGTTDRADVQFGKISFYAKPGDLHELASGLIRPLNNDSEFVSGYAKTNSAEDFAESFLEYVLAGKIFRERAKSNLYLKTKYDFLKEHIFSGVEYDTGSIENFNLWHSKNIGIPSYSLDYLTEDPDFVWDYEYHEYLSN